MPTEQVPTDSITFPATVIGGFRRADGAVGVVRFQSNIARDADELFQTLGWELPEEHCSFKRFDTVLRGGYFVLSSRDKLVDVEVDIEFTEISGFECHRIEGRKKSRRELRFKAAFKCEDGAANLESYMVRTNNARGSLKVVYVKDPVQAEITEEQLEIA